MRKRSGYVLLEIIISVFIMSIIITCLLSIMAVINRANKNIEDRIDFSNHSFNRRKYEYNKYNDNR